MYLSDLLIKFQIYLSFSFMDYVSFVTVFILKYKKTRRKISLFINLPMKMCISESLRKKREQTLPNLIHDKSNLRFSQC